MTNVIVRVSNAELCNRRIATIRTLFEMMTKYLSFFLPNFSNQISHSCKQNECENEFFCKGKMQIQGFTVYFIFINEQQQERVLKGKRFMLARRQSDLPFI